MAQIQGQPPEAAVNGKPPPAKDGGTAAPTIFSQDTEVGNAIPAAIKSVQFADPESRFASPSVEAQITKTNKLAVQQLPTGISIAATSLTPGAPPIMVSNGPVSFGKSSLVLGANAVPYSSFNTTPVPKQQPDTIKHHHYNSTPGGISIAGTTLTPGAPAIIVSITPCFFGGSLVLGTNAVPYNLPVQALSAAVFGGQDIQPATDGISIARTTLTPGAAPITVSGMPISLGSSAIFFGTSTVPYTPPSPSAQHHTSPR